jgi:Domain of unknown function (DUF5943)
MSELPVPVWVDPETGAWSVDGQAMVLVPRHFWVFVQMECERRFGLEATRGLYHAATYKAARLWCEREAKTHGREGVEVFRHYLNRMSQRGWGRMTIEEVEPGQGTARVRIDHSVFVREYGAKAGRRVCYMFASAFVGGMEYVAASAGKPLALAAAESACVAEGAPYCSIEVRPIASALAT